MMFNITDYIDFKWQEDNWVDLELEEGITVDVRSKDALYITIGDWVIYLDNSTNE